VNWFNSSDRLPFKQGSIVNFDKNDLIKLYCCIIYFDLRKNLWLLIVLKLFLNKLWHFRDRFCAYNELLYAWL
jgi:hypothetical protein